MSDTGSFHISTGLDVLPPKSGKAYPIPCDEWELLKGKLTKVSETPWFFQTAGSILAGVAVQCSSLSCLVLCPRPLNQTLGWSRGLP